MRKKAKNLVFISRIKRDGSGTEPVSEALIKLLTEDNKVYKLHTLSLSEKTFIIHDFNSFVVKIKTEPRV